MNATFQQGPVFGRAVFWVVILGLGAVLWACATEPPPAPKKKPKPYVPPTVVQPEPIGNIDEFGNLRGKGEMRFGFEVPMGAELHSETEDLATFHVAATLERLKRYYRSRGHLLIKETGTWRAAHSDRTLRTLGDDAETVRKATVRMTPGQNMGWLLRYSSGHSAPVAHTPLMKLIEAERRAENAPSAAVNPQKPTAKPTPSREELRQLREKAFRKRKPPKGARDITKEVYEWTRANPEHQFLD